MKMRGAYPIYLMMPGFPFAAGRRRGFAMKKPALGLVWRGSSARRPAPERLAIKMQRDVRAKEETTDPSRICGLKSDKGGVDQPVRHAHVDNMEVLHETRTDGDPR
jgi:hypothetical protein